MKKKSEAAAEPYLPAGSPRWDLVVRIAASAQFAKSTRLKDFLYYIAERSLTNRLDEITEFQIGVNVFERDANYNPAEDNIVRVNARFLRGRLNDYFEAAGADEPEIIEIPKGSYVPVFRPRVVEPAAIVDAPRPSPRRWPWPALAAIALLMGLCAWLWQENRGLRTAAGARPGTGNIVGLLVLKPGYPACLVTSDSSLVVLQRLANRNFTLEEYAEQRYLADPTLFGGTAKPVWGYLFTRPYTSFSDLVLYSRIIKANPGAIDHLSIRHARSLQSRDFQQGSFIIAGSPRSNPWGSMFDAQLNFCFRYSNELQRSGIVNLSARTGEPPEYISKAPGEASGEGFATIAVLPNGGAGGTVLKIAGTSSEATEAAGQYALDPATPDALRRRFRVQDLQKVESFELLLRTSAIGGTAREATVLADRVKLRR